MKVKYIWQDFVYFFTSRIKFINWLLVSLCELEMSLRYTYSQTLQSMLNNAYREDYIPKGLYCYYKTTCPYRAISNLARFFFGTQCSGYCYYKSKGDFSLIRPTMLLWDACKECGVNDEIED